MKNNYFKGLSASILLSLAFFACTTTTTGGDNSTTPTNYTVTFNANGGSAVASAQVASGNKATKPTDPTRAGYGFAGWYTNAAGTGTAFDFTTQTITANITLYAKWTGSFCTGSFVNGTKTTSGQVSINADKTSLSLETFKTGTGPDVNVYLAADATNVLADYKDLGDIKGFDGNYVHTLPAGIDYTKYKHVVIWCIAFKANFGHATLSCK